MSYLDAVLAGFNVCLQYTIFHESDPLLAAISHETISGMRVSEIRHWLIDEAFRIVNHPELFAHNETMQADFCYSVIRYAEAQEEAEQIIASNHDLQAAFKESFGIGDPETTEDEVEETQHIPDSVLYPWKFQLGLDNSPLGRDFAVPSGATKIGTIVLGEGALSLLQSWRDEFRSAYREVMLSMDPEDRFPYEEADLYDANGRLVVSTVKLTNGLTRRSIPYRVNADTTQNDGITDDMLPSQYHIDERLRNANANLDYLDGQPRPDRAPRPHTVLIVQYYVADGVGYEWDGKNVVPKGSQSYAIGELIVEPMD
ncbi:hypothetical protein BT63DRAFT_395510 [Microthyrium microscopicum]|uniref:Uncharacterized protein n=1 Tax=Microthyrium microscopicum TaxID=703497 RepID=A0A6A6URU2_9PEZI|nr:hypothetical protein BT63DRAFT_395510 [Microthyrium microscopicum]